MEVLKKIAIFISVLLLASCNLDNFSSKSSISVKTQIDLRALDLGLKSAKLTIDGSDMAKLEFLSDTGIFNIKVPKGERRFFTLDIELLDGTKLTGSSVSDLLDDSVIVIINLKVDSIPIQGYYSFQITSVDPMMSFVGSGDISSITIVGETISWIVSNKQEHKGLHENYRGSNFSIENDKTIVINGDENIGETIFNLTYENSLGGSFIAHYTGDLETPKFDIKGSFEAFEKSNNTDILKVLLNNCEGVIDNVDKKITITLPYGTVLTKSLTPFFYIPLGASYSPNTPQDFSLNPNITYSVTAEDGTKIDYNLLVEVALQ